MLIEVSIGEVLDKMSILTIKLNKIQDSEKLRNVAKELSHLNKKIEKGMIEDGLYEALCGVNGKLWDVEDKLREHEREQNFNYTFVELARSVYHLNDTRARIKKEINVKYGSDFIEEKSYEKY
jgi:hypothetical protein